MDIKKIAAKPDALILLKDAHGNELEDENGKVSVTICSPATARWKAALVTYQSELAEGTDEGTARALFCAECTLAVRNLDYGEAKNDFSKVYHDPDLAFIRDQVFTAAQRWGNFSANTKKSRRFTPVM